jgi:hypothetical protein
VARRHTPSDITPLLPYLHEPYRKEELIAAAKLLQPPFLLREIAAATGLPNYTCQRILGRLVKQGKATRRKLRITYPGYSHGRVIPGGCVRNVWAYTLVAGE